MEHCFFSFPPQSDTKKPKKKIQDVSFLLVSSLCSPGRSSTISGSWHFKDHDGMQRSYSSKGVDVQILSCGNTGRRMYVL